MIKIYKTSDLLPVKIHDVEFKISPLTFEHRSAIQGILSEAAKNNDMAKMAEASFFAIKYAVKEIKGIESWDGSPFELEIKDKVLTDECVNDLLNLEIFPELAKVSSALINGVPSQILDEAGQPVKGIVLQYANGAKRPNSKRTKKK